MNSMAYDIVNCRKKLNLHVIWRFALPFRSAGSIESVLCFNTRGCPTKLNIRCYKFDI